MTKLPYKFGCVVAVVLVMALLAGVAAEDLGNVLIVLEPVYLPYDDGSSVLLPPGNYSSISKIDGVWYVNGTVYPADDTEIPDYLPEDDLFAYVIIGCVLVGVVGAVMVLYMRRSNDSY
jgi:hypothetical protein